MDCPRGRRDVAGTHVRWTLCTCEHGYGRERTTAVVQYSALLYCASRIEGIDGASASGVLGTLVFTPHTIFSIWTTDPSGIQVGLEYFPSDDLSA